MLALAIALGGLAVAFAAAWWRERAQRRQAAAAQARASEEAVRVRETALQEMAQRYQRLFDRMLEGVIVLDADQRVKLANRAATALFGLASDVAGRTLLEVLRNHEVAALADRLRREEAIAGYELRLEGTPPRFLQINAVALRDSEERVNGAVLVFHDLTRVRELENARQEFVANVSHELRTPLSLIKGAVEILLDGATGEAEPRARLLQIVDRHADRLTLLIDDLLLLAQLDSGRVRLNRQTISARTAVQEVIDDLGSRAGARAVKLHNEVANGLLVRADADRVRQVFFNLIDNALKYGKQGGNVHISAMRKGEQVELAVRDDGPGIAPEAQARVFERFYRVDKARSREQGGTGLGLAIVKHVVQAHGGEVRVESTPGQGATFYFTLDHADGSSAQQQKP